MSDLVRSDETVIEETVEELETQMERAQGFAEKGRIARLITQRLESESLKKETELLDECAYLEASLRTKHKLDVTRVIGVCSIHVLMRSGHGIFVVRDLDTDDRPAAVKAFSRMAVDAKGEASVGMFSDDPTVVVTALMKCSLHPDPKTTEGQHLIQRLCRDEFPFASAAYKSACRMSGVFTKDSAAKSGG